MLALVNTFVPEDTRNERRYCAVIDSIPHELWLVIFALVEDAATLRACAKVGQGRGMRGPSRCARKPCTRVLPASAK